MKSPKQIGKTLKKARKEIGLTQVQIAEKVGISSNYYSMLETGKRENPGSKIMTKIAKVLKLSPEDVFPI
ncbi:MAG: helix-turn-helix transcriptional regulator [Patescibacteria group bacterium]